MAITNDLGSKKSPVSPDSPLNRGDDMVVSARRTTTAKEFIERYDTQTIKTDFTEGWGNLLKGDLQGFFYKKDGKLDDKEVMEAKIGFLKDFISLSLTERDKVLAGMDTDTKNTLSYMIAVTIHFLGASEPSADLKSLVHFAPDAKEPVTKTEVDYGSGHYPVVSHNYTFRLIGTGETRTLHAC